MEAKRRAEVFLAQGESIFTLDYFLKPSLAQVNVLFRRHTLLVFSGNKPAALQLIDHAWPADVPDKNEFWSSYEEALHASKYYSDFEKQL